MSERSPEGDARRLLTRYEKQPYQKATIAEMVEWCAQHDLDPAEVRLCGGFTFMWKSPETDAEAERRMAALQASEDRQREWVRKRAKELFDVVIPPGVQ